MMYPEKRLQKFLEKLEALSTQLYREQSVGLHQAINQFYYLQKTEEMKYFLAKLRELEEQQARLAKMIETEYSQVYQQWRKDVRVLSNHQGNKARSNSVF